MGMRRIGSKQRDTQRARTRARNRPRKIRERAARDRRMLAAISAGSLPYVPWVMSWLSAKLDKPSNAIVQDDVAGIVSAHASASA